MKIEKTTLIECSKALIMVIMPYERKEDLRKDPLWKNRLDMEKVFQMLTSREVKKDQMKFEYLAWLFLSNPNETSYEICKYTESLKKPIYFIIEDGMDWDKLKDIDYRKVYPTPLVTPELIEMVKRDIKEDLDFLKKVGGK